MKRIKVVPCRPNALFEDWLTEWKNAAKDRSDKHYMGLSKALSSLKKYPLKLETGKDCIIIQNFGNKLCQMIDVKLAKHLEAQAKLSAENALTSSLNTSPKRKKPKAKKPKSPSTKQVNGDKEILPVLPSPPLSPPPPPLRLPPLVREETNIALRFKPSTFDVLLLVDCHEVERGKQGDDETTTELKKTGILFETRHLNVGDFAWIARCRSSGRELVLPYIVERKRIDDLSGSVNDGRFREQKFRLKRSGIENVIYMVEHRPGYEKSDHGMPISRLRQAATNTMIQDEFTVRYTRNHRDSMLYLATMTTALTQKYKEKELVESAKEDLVPSNLLGKTIYLLEFQKFDQAGAKIKALKVKDMFVRQLIKLKGLSLAKVSAIVNKYPSPLALRNALRHSANGEQMLASITYGPANKNLGPAVAKVVYQLYTRDVLK